MERCLVKHQEKLYFYLCHFYSCMFLLLLNFEKDEFSTVYGLSCISKGRTVSVSDVSSCFTTWGRPIFWTSFYPLCSVLLCTHVSSCPNTRDVKDNIFKLCYILYFFLHCSRPLLREFPVHHVLFPSSIKNIKFDLCPIKYKHFFRSVNVLAMNVCK